MASPATSLTTKPHPHRARECEDLKMTTTCEPCELRDRGEFERAEKINGIHMQRLVLAVLNGQPASDAGLMAEVNDCVKCAIHLSAQFAAYCAQALVIIKGGSAEAAKQGLELSLMEDINDLPPDDGPLFER